MTEAMVGERIMRLSKGVVFFALALASCGPTDRAMLVEAPQDAVVPHLPLQAGQKLVAACGASKGYSYFPELGLVGKDDAGFQENGISDGNFYLVEQQGGAFDLIFKDVAREPMSAVEDGATLQKLRESESDAAYLVMYGSGAQTAEIYTFYKEPEGKLTFTTLSSKGSKAFAPHSSLFAGSCREVTFAESRE